MKFKSGVLKGSEVDELINYAKSQEFALPAINVVGTNSINAALEAARKVQSPVIIQFSNAAAHFIAGRSLNNNSQRAAVVGAVAAAQHVHKVATNYEVPVLLHTDHANRGLLPWIDGLLEENYKYYEKNGEPLFSSHMLDLSAEPLKENLGTCKYYLEKMQDLGITLEIELGVTGGVEDGFDHSDVEESNLFTQPDEIEYAYQQLSAISNKFTIAAAFGNVHGIYNPENVKLKPHILKDAQELIRNNYGTDKNPVSFVFHGGSGCTPNQLQEAISYGTFKMNINTDLQWAFWKQIKDYYKKHELYLQSQIGNPAGKDKSNKPYYNPQIWLREGEHGIVKRLIKTFQDLNCIGRNK